MEDLAESRAGVVDAADAERRRIERDLHDGAQQRLVSLAMNLGLARKTLKDVSPEAMRVIVEAHEEAQAAIVELRDLVRGLHPVVLEDRGLDAALSGVAARMPIPVRLTVNAPRRPPPRSRRSPTSWSPRASPTSPSMRRATQADVFVQQDGDRLHVIVTDDGVGGADPGPRHRPGRPRPGAPNRSTEILEIASPPGGPTLLTVDLPECAAVAGPGRSVWVLSGLVTAAVLVVPGARLIDLGYRPGNVSPSRRPSRPAR